MTDRFRMVLATALTSVMLMVPAFAEPVTIEVQKATVAVDPRANDLAVLTITMTPDGRLAFGRFTEEHVGRRVDVRIDGKVVMRPIIREPILRGVLQISGPPLEELRQLANRLSAGNVKLEVDLAPD